MSGPIQTSTPADRERAKARLRTLTRGAVVAAAGATVALGVVVAHDRPGASAADHCRVRIHLVHVEQWELLVGQHLRHFQLRHHWEHREHRELRHLVFRLDPDVKLPVAHRDIGRNLAVTKGTDVIEPVLTTRSFRAIGTTATVVVQAPGDARGGRADPRGRARRLRPRLQSFPPGLGIAVGARQCRAHRRGERAALRGPLRRLRRGRAHGRRCRPHYRQRHRGAGLRRRPGRGAVPSARPAAGAGTGGGLSARAAQSAPTAPSASRAASGSTSARPPRPWPPTARPPALPAGSAPAPS